MGRRRRRRAISTSRGSRGRRPRRRGRSHPGTVFWPRTPDSRAPSSRRGSPGRPARGRDRRDGRQAARAPGDARGRHADRARRRRRDRVPRGGGAPKRPRNRLPIAVKASGGGGGKGLKVAHRSASSPRPFDDGAARGRGVLRATGRSTLAVLDNAKHVELQILGDKHGTVPARGRARLFAAAPSPKTARRRRPR